MLCCTYVGDHLIEIVSWRDENQNGNEIFLSSFISNEIRIKVKRVGAVRETVRLGSYVFIYDENLFNSRLL